eukprot:CAMPEP_0119287884 /NCGR_PEP_ID=MMETSP1329-20130426/36334_1 /TAXON_ID=114041 /ORGANISM="Genus nov. species nov., Strain RCC1024" /LENGTH=48 /DNA_ID= /DNA_START= /DNA_END= /DNA_ORIENTATION=
MALDDLEQKIKAAMKRSHVLTSGGAAPEEPPAPAAPAYVEPKPVPLSP